MDINPSAIPQALRATDNWVVWRYEAVKGKTTKVPYDIAGNRASTTDPRTWTSIFRATELVGPKSKWGLGFVFDDDFIGVDLDHAYQDDGKLKPWAQDIVNSCKTYTEISPSGKGLHLISRGRLPEGWKGLKRAYHDGAVEIYSTGRYFTVTGNRLAIAPTTIEDQSAFILGLYQKLDANPVVKVHTYGAPPQQTSVSVVVEERKNDPILVKVTRPNGKPVSPIPLDVALEAAKNDSLFNRLWNKEIKIGSEYPSQSEADQALCNKLAFYVGHDRQAIDDAFRQSGLMRTKWIMHNSYRENTISKAINGTADTYQPPKSKTEKTTHATSQPEVRTKPINEPRKEISETEHANQQFNRTDAGNGELLASLYGARFRHDWSRDRDLLFDRHRWRQEDVAGELVSLAKAAARERYLRAVHISDTKEREHEARWAIQSEQKARIEAALYMARTESPISDKTKDWDNRPLLFAVENGVVDLKTGLLRDGRQDDRLILYSPITFDANAKCPLFEKFLVEILNHDAELVDFVHRAIGYSLTAFTTEQVLFILFGSGANGKTVFLSILRAVLGQYAHNMPFSTVELYDRASIPNDVAALRDRRLVTAAETNDGARFNEGRIKALTGGDPITARFLHHEFFTFQPVAKFWLSVNHKPKVSDDSYGFWRRVRLIPFLRQFRQDADPDLEKKLRAELPGILAFCVRGCLEWQKRGLQPPESITKATEDYRQESDPLSGFKADRCISGKDFEVTAADAYKAYILWAQQQGFREKEIMTVHAFGRSFGDAFLRKRTSSGRIYTGVRLTE